MKKFFIFAAAACVALASCTKNETSFTNNSAEGAEVLFNAPLLSKATKATEIKGTTFPTDVNFVVFGYYQEGKLPYDANGNAELYMDEVKCQYTTDIVDAAAGTGTWKHATDKYYWPKNGMLNFVAASPAEDDVDVACAYTVESTKSTLTLAYTAPDNHELQEDILYSDWKKNCTASTHVNNEAYDGVELAFNHALSVVRINVRAKDEASAEAVRVTGLSINKVYKSGVFTSDEISASQSWSFAGKTRADYTLIAKVSDAVMEAGAPYTGSMPIAYADDGSYVNFANYILLPQSYDAESNITINYSIKHKVMNDDRTDYIEKWLPQTHVFKLADAGHKVAAVDGAQITEWVKGTRYTYDVTIGVDEIYFAPSVSDWADVKVEYDNETPQYKQDDPLYGNN